MSLVEWLCIESWFFVGVFFVIVGFLFVCFAFKVFGTKDEKGFCSKHKSKKTPISMYTM